MMKTLPLLALLPVLAFAQGTAPTFINVSLEAPPFYENFASLATGNLSGQNDWLAKAAGDTIVKILNGTGAYGNEPTWDEHFRVVLKTNVQDLNANQFAVAVWADTGNATSNAIGVACRSDTAGTTFYSGVYTDGDQRLRLYRTIAGTGTQFTFYQTAGIAIGDSIKLVVNNDTCYLYHNTNLRIQQYTTHITSGVRAGVAVNGGSASAGQSFSTWRAGNWP